MDVAEHGVEKRCDNWPQLAVFVCFYFVLFSGCCLMGNWTICIGLYFGYFCGKIIQNREVIFKLHYIFWHSYENAYFSLDKFVVHKNM